MPNTNSLRREHLPVQELTSQLTLQLLKTKLIENLKTNKKIYGHQIKEIDPSENERHTRLKVLVEVTGLLKQLVKVRLTVQYTLH
jgi:transposase-like protein